MRTPTARVIFITRRNCDLCDEAYGHLLRAARHLGVTIEVRDVDADAQLMADYGTSVPVVVAADGAVLATGALSRLRAYSVALRARFT